MSDIRPLVSVCIITFNQQEYIEDCLKGAVNQDFRGTYEIVIGEDCSTDKTGDICRKFAKNHPEVIRLLERQENLGMMQNFISTIGACRGKYIAVCEGDDYWTDHLKLQKQFDAMEGNLSIDLSFHQCDILDTDNSFKIKEFSKYENLEIVELKDVIQGNGGLIPMASIFFRRSILNKYLEHVGKFSGAHFLLQVLGSLNGALFLKSNMAVYRKNSSTSIIKNVKNDAKNYEYWISNHIEKLNNLKTLTSHLYDNLLEALILKEKLSALRSFKTSQEYKKKLYKELIRCRSLSFVDLIIYNFIFKNKITQDFTEKAYRIINGR